MSCGFPVACEGSLCLFGGDIDSNQHVCISTVITLLHANTRRTLMSDTAPTGTNYTAHSGSVTTESSESESAMLHLNTDLKGLS